MNVEVDEGEEGQWPTRLCDARMGKVLGALPATLTNLRSMSLHVPAFGARTAQSVARLVQLTELSIQPMAGHPAESTSAAADLTPLSRLTNLKKLLMCGTPPVQPAAGQGGPYSFPSSLTSLDVDAVGHSDGAIGCWVTHLAGCPHLQQLGLVYNKREHASAHPAAVVCLLAQNNRSLRVLWLDEAGNHPTWDAAVAGLPDATNAGVEWHPDAALASLTGLELLVADRYLDITTAADWQHMAQLFALTRLSGANIHTAPPQLAGPSLRELNCMVALGGWAVGELLLACPQLQRASLYMAPDKPLLWHHQQPHTYTYMQPSSGFGWGPAATGDLQRQATLPNWPLC
jgi:hypothetical protein